VVFGSAELYDHDYLENAFDCVLPFYVGATPKGRVTIRDNSAFDVVNTFIAVRPQAPLPNEILDVGGNAVHTRNRNLKVFDRDDYAHSPRVHNLRTNTILVEGG
jgi:hypothetical protein